MQLKTLQQCDTSVFTLGCYLMVVGTCLYPGDGEAKEIKLSCRLFTSDTILSDEYNYKYSGIVVELIVDETTKKFARRSISESGEKSAWSVEDVTEITDHSIKLDSYDYGKVSGFSGVDRITGMYLTAHVDWREEGNDSGDAGICEPKLSLRWPAQRF